MISATADGGSVNFGIYKSLLTQLSEDRPWLLKIHCVNHRLELAVKDAMKDSPLFILAHRMYTTIYYLLQNSGPLSAEVKNACKALNITYYELTRLAGTRFIGHKEKGFRRFLHLWPALKMAFENQKL